MYFSNSEIMRLIQAVKNNPIIWDTNSPDYSNRKKKAEVWNRISKEIEVHPELCKKKMESLMSSFRREKNRLIESQKSNNLGEKPSPRWIYWNQFRFLRGLADGEEDPLGSCPEKNSSQHEKNSLWSTSQKLLAQEAQKANAAPVVNLKPQSSMTVPRAETPTNFEESFITTVPNDEYAAIGVLVEAKLNKMDQRQKLLAENIINQAMFQGILFQLTEQSHVGQMEKQKASNSTVTNSNEKIRAPDITISQSSFTLQKNDSDKQNDVRKNTENSDGTSQQHQLEISSIEGRIQIEPTSKQQISD